jgi:flavin reductase (DIM6/NTAB) family NADH-FMN oxidoreductase RutF
MDQQVGARFRDVMGRFPTGVTVVAACLPGSEPWGLTVNSFTSVSLDPPLVLVCIQKDGQSHQRLLDTEWFAVSILAAEQAEIARRFSSEPTGNRFEDVKWSEAGRGSPILDDAAAWLECSIQEVMPGGDHSIVIGRVESWGTSERGALLFYSGEYKAAVL